MRLKVLSLIFIFFSLAALAGSGEAINSSSNNDKLLASAAEAEVTADNNSKLLLAEEKLNQLYRSIDYGKNARPAYDVFRKGMVGYLNLLRQDKISNKGILTIIDFSIPSVKKRLWVFDLKNRKLLFHDLVAHGKNSGHNIANAFSNIPESNQSSLGFYVTANTYVGKHGLSLRLKGQETGFNDKAMARAIVMHGADYVNTSIIKSMGRLGRSFGCPALSRAISDQVINTVADRTCLFIYHPSKEYLDNSVYLQEAGAIDYLLATNI
ncbi:murein L,D-transpeptidase catalytic domain family protein [Cesiribacter sp. SM1]|uniref:murein L,D-transpeptidase catalytic domain family protein n=1 Tax=Cesiribacter sp. SM1 TaxID=2861196 RepID=UPI001CD2AA10|nr:murein L,D-transpeptidase catalytic domain family protein [Cesiribacter sp. SM1]